MVDCKRSRISLARGKADEMVIQSPFQLLPLNVRLICLRPAITRQSLTKFIIITPFRLYAKYSVTYMHQPRKQPAWCVQNGKKS